jgi:hypothetical protein
LLHKPISLQINTNYAWLLLCFGSKKLSHMMPIWKMIEYLRHPLVRARPVEAKIIA